MDHDETTAPGMMRKLGDDEDVEGHSLRRGVEPGSIMAPRNDGGPDDFKSARISRSRVDEGDDDVEGHLGRLQSPKSRGE